MFMYYMYCDLADLLVWHLQQARKSTQVAWNMSAPEGWTLSLYLLLTCLNGHLKCTS